jgi:hypothetical protein
MTHVLVVDMDTMSISSIDPPKGPHGQPLPPEGMRHVRMVEVTDIQYRVIANAINAQFTVDPDTGTITATEIPPDPPSELEVARQDIRDAGQNMMDRLDQIMTNDQAIIDATSMTPAQAAAAIKQLANMQQDMARFQKRSIRFQRAT